MKYSQIEVPKLVLIPDSGVYQMNTLTFPGSTAVFVKWIDNLHFPGDQLTPSFIAYYWDVNE